MFGLGVLRLRKRMKRKKQNLSYPIFVCLDCKISWPIFTNLFKNSSFSICLSYEIIQTLRTVNENCLNLFFSFKFKIMDETFLNLCFLTTYLIKKKNISFSIIKYINIAVSEEKQLLLETKSSIFVVTRIIDPLSLS